jgi:hypothetical protein
MGLIGWKIYQEHALECASAELKVDKEVVQALVAHRSAAMLSGRRQQS